MQNENVFASYSIYIDGNLAVLNQSESNFDNFLKYPELHIQLIKLTNDAMK